MAIQVGDLYAKLGLRTDSAGWQRGMSMVKGLTLGLAGLATYGAVKATKALIGVANEAIEAGNKIDKLTQETGVGAKFLQELAFAAGHPVEKLDDAGAALKKFGLTLEDALTNKGSPARKALADLGISMNDPAVKARDLETITKRVAMGIRLMDNGTQKMAVTAALYGSKLGPGMIEPLNELAEKTALYNKLGGALTDKDIPALDAASGAVSDLGAAWDMVKLRAGAALGPFIQNMAEKAVGWLTKNRDKITEWLTVATRFVLTALSKIAAWGAKAFKWIDDHSEEIKKFFTDAAATAVGLINAIVSVYEGVKATIKWFTDLGVSIGAFVFEAKEKILGFANGIKQAFIDIGEAIKGFFTGVFDYVGKGFRSFAKASGLSYILPSLAEEEPLNVVPLQPSEGNSTFARSLMGADYASMVASQAPLTNRGGSAPSVGGSNVNVTVNTSASDVRPIIAKQIQADADRRIRDAFASATGVTL